MISLTALSPAHRLNGPDTNGGLPMKKIVITLLSLFALMSIASNAMAADATAWEKTKALTSTVVEWTVDKSVQGWQATKNGAANITGWAAEKSKQGWKATKQGTGHLAQWTAEKAKQGWQATKRGTANAGKWVTEKNENAMKHNKKPATGLTA
ncbi:hypothetical protein [Mariprofundus ferrooxydans]|nr:hypothetical protein [Mariprofundus ferrooxydans]